MRGIVVWSVLVDVSGILSRLAFHVASYHDTGNMWSGGYGGRLRLARRAASQIPELEAIVQHSDKNIVSADVVVAGKCVVIQ